MGAAALHRLAGGFWPLLQQTAAAVIAWTIADAVGGARQPFFAPIAAVVALNAVRGRRGVNALHLLAGVILGIGVGELTLIGPGGGTASMAVAVLVATALAAALGENRLVIAQAAAGAILTVAVGDDRVGVFRIVDALIGAGVALVFTQLLFTPEPVALLRRAEAAALDGMAAGLGTAARALAHEGAGEDADRLAAAAIETLRDPDDRVGEVDRMRRAITTLPRYSLAWRPRSGHSAREEENADRLGLLGAACLMLARTALAAGRDGRAALARALGEVAGALDALAADPGDRGARRDAANRVLAAVTDAAADLGAPGEGERGPVPADLDAFAALRLVTADVLVFTGVPHREAVAAVRAGTGEFEIPAPPGPPRLPLVSALHRRLSRRVHRPRRPRRGAGGRGG
ncbi:FUSC family protein [Actinomadura algeriensis]|uniref:Integral membrane bound transporter domain-containing protein n=1 Tax=Actinomadura algeriensis TaxID=1679523 RepID=A0ABR9K1H2_9ACTN|nr:FUSC family protein [Actinomadura algeriensis]MBE1536689.1 hypothetical protein [Actinomadura algeriensis]